MFLKTLKIGNPKTIRFIIPGVPRMKERARTVMGRTKPYTPQRTTKYEEEIWTMALKAGARQHMFVHVPVWLGVRAFFDRPKKPVCEFPIGKPDLDNIIKVVSDGLKPAMLDDAQIVGYLDGIGKFYGSPERIEVTLTTESTFKEINA